MLIVPSLTSLLAALALLPAAPSETDLALDTLAACTDVSDAKCITAAAQLKIAGDAALGPVAARVEKLGSPGQMLVLTVFADEVRPETTDMLLRLARSKSAEPGIRAVAIDALAKRHDARVPALTQGLMGDGSVLVRQASVRALANMVTAKDRRIIGALQRAARDKAPEVRAEAAYGLGFCNCSQAGPVLTKALDDTAVDVQRAAAQGLSFVRHAPAVAHLVPLLRAEDELLRRSVGRALRFQTDENLGDDAVAWEQWLTTHHR
ncbi:MAG: HEAT repeat domain-containing protein [Myxococcota bacterium]